MKFSAAFLLILTISVASSAKFVDDPYFVAMENREIRFQKSELSKLEYSCKHAQTNLQKLIDGARRYYKGLDKLRNDALKKKATRLAEIAHYRRSDPHKAALLLAKHKKLLIQERRFTTGPPSRYGFLLSQRIQSARNLVKNCPSKLKAQRQYIETLQKKIDQERERRSEEDQN